jgi:hypothetical protein
MNAFNHDSEPGKGGKEAVVPVVSEEEVVRKRDKTAFWRVVYGLPALPSALLASLILLLRSGTLEGQAWLEFAVSMLLAMGTFIGFLVTFPLAGLAIGLWVFPLEGWPKLRSRLLGVSCLLTAVVLLASCFWIWSIRDW